MVSLDLIIIDGDQTLTDGGSCVPPQQVHEVLKAENITHVIYNSYSNDIINSKFKWRACIPSDDIIDAEALQAGVEEIISLLHGAGLPVRNVHENLVLSQPWFTPRCPEHTIDDFYSAWHDGQTYRIGERKVLDTAHVDSVKDSEIQGKDSPGQFSWDYVISEFARGTLHMGLKSACGWLVRTTDWVDAQIKSHLLAIARATCPDKAKLARAEKGEIDKLIKYCRKKSGIYVEQKAPDWKERCITAAELRDKEFPPVNWAVEGIIPEGLCVFAGDPKVGKSLVAVDICSAIASGVKGFGSRPCVAGGAVYISLEDPERRVKSRIAIQCDRWPETFRLVTGGIPTVGDEFFHIMDEMVMLWPDTRCIVIDTLQFIIPSKQPGRSDYEHFYKFLAPLHEWAIENHIAVVLIHHTTKGQAINGENPFDKINGSQAISGCADTMILLQRNHAKTTKDPSIADGFMHIQGREVGKECLAMDWDEEALIWTIISEAQGDEATGNTRWLEIMDALKKHGPIGPKDLSGLVGINYSTTKTCLRRMKAKSLIRSDDGKWFVPGYEKRDCEW
jgi:hypothetical protein